MAKRNIKKTVTGKSTKMKGRAGATAKATACTFTIPGKLVVGLKAAAKEEGVGFKTYLLNNLGKIAGV
jgi:hypothetical protein